MGTPPPPRAPETRLSSIRQRTRQRAASADRVRKPRQHAYRTDLSRAEMPVTVIKSEDQYKDIVSFRTPLTHSK